MGRIDSDNMRSRAAGLSKIWFRIWILWRDQTFDDRKDQEIFNPFLSFEDFMGHDK